jgi:hypothetical protein
MTDLRKSIWYGPFGFLIQLVVCAITQYKKKRVAEWLSLVAMTEYKINYFAIYQANSALHL